MAITRRSALEGVFSLALFAPVLRQLEANAAGVNPRRLVVIYSPNGPMLIDRCVTAAGSSQNFTFNDFYKSFDSIRTAAKEFPGIMVSGLAAPAGGGGGHEVGGASTLTGRRPSIRDTGQGPSIETFIGKSIGGVRQSVLWGLYSGDSYSGWGPWFNGPADERNPEENPFSAYDQLFNGFMFPKSGATPVTTAPQTPSVGFQTLASRRSVLDAVAKDCALFKGRLGAEGKRILDAHCSNLRAIETSISELIALQKIQNDNPASSAAQCVQTDLSSGNVNKNNVTERSNLDIRVQIFAKLSALAFACQLTRVIGFGIGRASERMYIPLSYGAPASGKVDSGDEGDQHHAWSHNFGDESRNANRIFNDWYAKCATVFYKELANANDAGGGKIIDSSLIFWATEFGGGNENTDSHPGFNKTVALLGGADGFLKKNQYVEVSGDTNARSVANNQILTTICRYMGVAGSFGEGAGSNTTLQSIIA